MLMAVQHGEELEGMLGRLPSLPGIPVQQLWDQLLESSNLFLSPGDFCSVFCEVLFQAGQEVGCFPRNPLAPAGRHVCERGDSDICLLGEPAAGQGCSHGAGKGLHSFSNE